MNGQSQSKYTVWHFIGCGCTVLVLLGLIAVAGFIWFGKQMVDGLKAGFEDPEVRAAQTRKILGYDELPEGYYPGFTMSVPFMMDMATLGDKDLPADTDLSDEPHERGFGGKLFDRSGFLYVKARSVGDKESTDLEGEMNLDLHLQRRIGEGTVEAGGADVHYASSFAYGTSDGERVPTVSSDLEIECLADPYIRKAVWFTAGPEDPGGEIDPASLAGTAADPDAMKAFLDHFDLCR
jgi:hypothetical protein